MRSIILPALSVLSIAACDQTADVTPIEAETPPPAEIIEAQPAEPEFELPQRNVAQRTTATIDWNAARADFAARESDDDVMAQVASGGSIAVPVLLPETSVGVASTGGENVLEFRPLADGYFAVKKGEIYDMIVNGTDKLIPSPEGDGIAEDTELAFEETMTGAQVAFSRYGASYLVEFMCHDPATAMKGSCISEEDALAEVESLLIAGTQ